MLSSWYNQDTVKISWYHQNIIKISSSYRNIIMISSRYHDINIISSSYHQDIMISWYQQHIIKLSSRYHDTARVRSIPPIPCIGIGITPIPVSASICCIDTSIIISQYRHLHGWYLYLYCSNGIVVSVFYHYVLPRAHSIAWQASACALNGKERKCAHQMVTTCLKIKGWIWTSNR